MYSYCNQLSNRGEGGGERIGFQNPDTNDYKESKKTDFNFSQLYVAHAA